MFVATGIGGDKRNLKESGEGMRAGASQYQLRSHSAEVEQVEWLRALKTALRTPWKKKILSTIPSCTIICDPHWPAGNGVWCIWACGEHWYLRCSRVFPATHFCCVSTWLLFLLLARKVSIRLSDGRHAVKRKAGAALEKGQCLSPLPTGEMAKGNAGKKSRHFKFLINQHPGCKRGGEGSEAALLLLLYHPSSRLVLSCSQ